ncbi:ABC transporter substrate-binding protein [Mesotoga prima]|uniref:ABC transporter substrate-binding protein n=1 Tax=Mesotoga prima TaxID=1184387 RepID=UPI001BD6CBFC|nr:ABC transporter substrate-binding protein [Mesotoga prima]HOZ99453.1 ABC transporter substrate-binding protein [Mesotoga prima]HQN60836.1 ABC transporter substrate-binding protein [Mesotoga prima]HUM21890.1 ABC transporter substrate-binding protein [Mesotoga prima]
MKQVLVCLLLLVGILGLSVQTVGITAIVEHPALDAVREGIIDVLEESGFKDGDNIVIDFQNAQGSVSTAVAIAKQFVSLKAAVMVGIATPSAQALVNASKTIPVVFSAVTDPVSASLVPAFGKNPGNVVGMSDMTPVKTQLQLLKLTLPDVERVGVIYNSGEANSVTIREFAKEACDALGMELIDITGSTTAEMVASLNAQIKDVDAIYIGTDNTAASSIESISTVALREKVAIVAGDIDIARSGGLIGFGFNYYQVGRATGELVVEILKGTPPSELETKILGQDSLILFVNTDIAKEIGVEIPQSVLDLANLIVTDGVETER